MDIDALATLEDSASTSIQTIDGKQPAKPLATHCSRTYLIIDLDGRPFAIDVSLVRHIDTIGQIWRIPGFPPFARGVTRIQDRLIPLIDLRLKLGLPEIEYGTRTCVVEVDVTVPMAVAVDSVERVSLHASSEIVPLPTAASASTRTGFSGVVQSEGRTCLILDIQQILMGQTAGVRDDGERSAKSRLGETPHAQSGASRKATTDADAPADRIPRIATMSVRDLGGSFAVNEPLIGLGGDTVLSLDAAKSHRKLVVPAKPDGAPAARPERLLMHLAGHVMVGTRRVPGFRRGDPRLLAFAAAVLQMPSTFRTADLAAAVGKTLGLVLNEYRLTHCRYDLGKLRARNLAERIGSSRRYRLTRIGRIVCERLAECRRSTSVMRLRPEQLPHSQRSALSA